MRLIFLLLIVVVSWPTRGIRGQGSTIALPAPAGPFAVGRTTRWWTDPSRLETATAGSHGRELQALIYYPAIAASKHAEYFPGLTNLDRTTDTKLLADHFASAWPAVQDGSVQSSAYENAAFATNAGKCPVLFFSPGGSAPVAAYSVQLEELASRGYVVVGLSHAYDTALIIRPDGRSIPFVDQTPQPSGPPTTAALEANLKVVVRWADDTRFALDQIEAVSHEKESPLFHNLDLARIGVFGHSLGGKAAARLCQTDRRVAACVNEDGELFGKPFGSTEAVPSVIPHRSLRAPFMDIYVAEPLANDAQLAAVHITRKAFEDWRHSKTEALRSFLKENGGQSYLVVINRPGFTHGTFMDIAELSALAAKTTASSAQANLGLANRLTLAFFDGMLRHDSRSWRQLVTAPADGATIETFEK